MADGGGRKLTIFAGIYTLMQGSLWCLAAVYCICFYKCIFKYPFPNGAKDSSGFYTIFYSSYLNGSCDGNPIFQGLRHAADSSQRTFYWMLGYSVLSALWALVSILLLVPNICNKNGSHSSKCTYYPWILITALVVISDVVSVIIYIMDISHTLGTHDYLDFIGASGSWEDVTGIAWKGQDTAAPAVAMTLFSSRLIIFWLLNFVLLYRIVNQCKSISLPDIDDTDKKYRSWEKPIISERQMEERTNPTQYLDPDPRNWKGVAQRRQVKMSDSGQRHNNYQSHAQQAPPRVTYKLDEFGIPIEEVRSPRAENYLDYGSEVPIVRPLREPNLLRRPSNRVAGQSMPPEELRGQVPWSYLRPPPPKPSSPSPGQQQQQQQQPPRGPVIPAPDYGYRNSRSHGDYQFSATTARK
ncbi:hypothetical protein LSTR_LSTR002146 [Laodelphax striatellus]|uniref:MARVEL domain-containing protein n=1 Tax=Laodelphax striatellus TaxID=195883 RepID=A0A482XRH2_LAOST|nr:hypothetical protein LSTR_LSTR002146 [Laodelphax striatellus]